MMKSNPNVADRPGGTGHQVLAQVLMYLGISLIGGGLAAGIALGMEKGITLLLIAVCGTVMALGAAAILGAIRIGSFDPPNLRSKTGRSQLILLTCGLIGALLGMYLVITDAIDRLIDGTFVLSEGEAIAGYVLLGLSFVIGLLWQNQMDEHDFASVKTASYWALSVYLYGSIGWWLGAAAGFLPGVDGGIVFISVLAVFTAVWFVKRAG
ncbi:hypothetical protein [Erythrobacter sp. R86502]|uniref:hypothetical protein n=1 Tax=Erythrobacter sp. R86502 TaxID=3093846 RepID=UPI0036D2B799